jgi:hypothetical protein
MREVLCPRGCARQVTHSTGLPPIFVPDQLREIARTVNRCVNTTTLTGAANLHIGRQVDALANFRKKLRIVRFGTSRTALDEK